MTLLQIAHNQFSWMHCRKPLAMVVRIADTIVTIEDIVKVKLQIS